MTVTPTSSSSSSSSSTAGTSVPPSTTGGGRIVLLCCSPLLLLYAFFLFSCLTEGNTFHWRDASSSSPFPELPLSSFLGSACSSLVFMSGSAQWENWSWGDHQPSLASQTIDGRNAFAWQVRKARDELERETNKQKKRKREAKESYSSAFVILHIFLPNKGKKYFSQPGNWNALSFARSPGVTISSTTTVSFWVTT